MENDIEKFLQFVHTNNFLEAHEILEDQWRHYKNNPTLRHESYILKGLINGATAFALKKLGRDSSANKVWGTFKKYESLIDIVDSQYTSKYKQARALLFQKYEEIFTCKSI